MSSSGVLVEAGPQLSSRSWIEEPRILIVDDARENVRLLELVLQEAGFTALRSVTDPLAAAEAFGSFNPDLVLLDLHMPKLDGIGVMQQLRPLIRPGEFRPIVVLTSDLADDARHRALVAGATDFVTKSFDQTEVVLRVRNLLETRSLYLQLQHQNALLEERVQERTRSLQEAQEQLLELERDKKRFYRDVILSVTHGKLNLIDRDELPSMASVFLDAPLHETTGYGIVRRELQSAALDSGMTGDRADDLVLAVGEAITNAIKHGSQGRCIAGCYEGSLVVRVQDSGEGILSHSLPQSVLRAGFSTKPSLGMGYTLMLELVDRIWLATGPDGTAVQLEKSIEPVDALLDFPVVD